MTVASETSVRLRSKEEYSELIGVGAAICDRPPGAMLAQAPSSAAATSGSAHRITVRHAAGRIRSDLPPFPDEARMALRVDVLFMVKFHCTG